MAFCILSLAIFELLVLPKLIELHITHTTITVPPLGPQALGSNNCPMGQGELAAWRPGGANFGGPQRRKPGEIYGKYDD